MTRGFFYFRLSNSRNLFGEFFNDVDTEIRTESADRNGNDNNENIFEGDYFSTWREGTSSEIMNLNISISTDNNRIFNLIWSRLNESKPTFRGQAMLIEENLLSGYYFVP